jgi:hypothetical protein
MSTAEPSDEAKRGGTAREAQIAANTNTALSVNDFVLLYSRFRTNY